MMFAGLTSAFIVKSNLEGWRTIKMPMLFWISTAVILGSSLTMQMALRSFKQRNMSQYRMLSGVTLVLGVAFIALQILGFRELYYDQQVRFKGASGAGQFLYVIFGLHAIHVLGGMIALITIFIKAFVGRVKTYSSVPLEVMTSYWHFVDLLWIYILLFFLIVG
ncbi:MAG: heme-copper oxidase subunit III [Pedobacter sp.]|nr:MAG: heme-copper oxidase subunit III [Pedobacter sp.]